MTIHIIYAIISWIINLAIRLPLIILGWPIVAIALRFKREDLSTARPFLHHNRHRSWWHVDLPRWAWLWSNTIDGAKGDPRGWWDANCPGKDSDAFVAQWVWLAWRNPVNNMRHTRPFAINMYDTQVELLAGQPEVNDHNRDGLGWQFVLARGPILRYYGFYSVTEMPRWLTRRVPSLKGRVWMVRLGWKVNPRYNAQYPTSEKSQATKEQRLRAWKGMTFRARPADLWETAAPVDPQFNHEGRA